MEWLHIVVITLIYVHEPKTVTWAKECEIPDYAYSEKRRKNQYGDEFVCLDRDVERDHKNSLYDTKLLNINTRKKIEDMNEDDEPYKFFKENRDPRYIQNNHYIHTALQPPTNKSTFQMLLYRFQPYGYGPYTMDTPKSVFNIYRTKSQDYEEDTPKELIVPAAQPAKEDVTTNWGMDVYTREANDVINQNQANDVISQNQANDLINKNHAIDVISQNHANDVINQNLTSDVISQNQANDVINQNHANDVINQNQKSLDQNKEFKISTNQQRAQIVTKQPIWTNDNTDNNKQKKLFAKNKVDLLEPNILMDGKLDLPEGRTLDVKIPSKIANIKDSIKPLPNINNSTNNSGLDEKLNTAYENMVTEIMVAYNSSDKTNADNQILMSDKKKIFQSNKFNKFKYLNPTYQIVKDVKASPLGHQWKQITGQQRMPMRHLKQKKGIWQKDNPTLASMPRSFNQAKVLDKKTQNIETKIFGTNPENEKIQDHYDLLMPENESAPEEYGFEAQKVLDYVQPDNVNNKLGEEKHQQADTITTLAETVSSNPSADVFSSELNKHITSDGMKKIENYPTIAHIKAKVKNPGWAHSFFTNHLKGFDGTLKEDQELIANSLQYNNAGNSIDQSIPYCSDSYKEAKYPRKLRSNEFCDPLSNNDFFQGTRDSQGIQVHKDFSNNLINNKDTIKIENTNNIQSNTINISGNNPGNLNIDKYRINNNKLHGITYINEDFLLDNELQYLNNIDKQKLEKKDCKFEIPVKSYLFNKKYKREDKETIPVDLDETKTDAEQNTKSSTLNESKRDRLSSTGESEDEMKINSNETHTEVKDRTVIKVDSTVVNFDFNNKDVTKPTSSFEKLYKKLNIFKSRDKEVKNRVGSNSTIIDNDVRDKRTVEKEKYKKEFDQEFLKKWMELQQAFMSHLETQSIPKFPVMNAVKGNGTSPPQFPVELKLNDDFNGFPIKLKESVESKTHNKKFEEANDVTTIVPLEATAIKNETQENKKRDIHCCFKLNDGQHCGEHDNDREQLKQIDLKIENKKMKGCPLKETCIEMILTKDKMIRDEGKSKLTNHSSTGNVFNDEMPPFRIGLKNYTNGKSKVSKIQGMREFNKINSLTKVNKSQDKWEKQIKKLYEIINEEKKEEERNKTTYSSLHEIIDKDQSRKLPQSQQVSNKSSTNDPVKYLKEGPQKLIINKPNHISLESKPGQNISTDQMQKLLKDKKSRKILANQIINECYNLNSNKKTVDPLTNDLKVRYQHIVNKFREDLMKIRDINDNNNSSYVRDQSFYTEGIKVNSPIVSISQGLQSKAINGNMLQNPDILLHKVYKPNQFIPNAQIKAKLLKKCENLKNNISQILILMSELQDEGKNNPESVNSCLQYTGFNNLLNNLKKFNRHQSFSSKYISGKDVSRLSKLRMGTMNLKDLGIKHEKADGINEKYIDVKQEKVDDINLRGAEEDRNSNAELDSPSMNLTDTTDIRLTVPTVETNEESITSKGSDATVLKSSDISVADKLSSDIVNTKVSEEIQNNVAIIQNGKKFAGLKVPDTTSNKNTDATIEKGNFDHVNEKDVEVSMVRKFSDEISGKKNFIMNETRPEMLNDKYVDSDIRESITEVYPSWEMLKEVTSDKGSDIFLDRGQHLSNESIIDSINGKSIIKLVQQETPGFDKYNQSSTASPSGSKEDAEIDKPSNENEPYIIKLASFPTNYNYSNLEKSNKKLGRVKCLSSNNSSGIFDMSKFSKIADQMQDIPHKLTMPIIMDILNSLMFHEESTHTSKIEEDPIEKRLKRDNFITSDAQISPSSENFEINVKVKKGKRKKNKKNKFLIHKSTKSNIKATTEVISIKSAKKNKSEQHKKNRIKPIYMPNLRGHSGIHVVPPFLFGDNIITISVTPCNDYYKNKKYNKNKYTYDNRGNLMIEEIKNNDTSSMVTEAKYFVMSNIKGDVTEKTKTRQETQLRIPLKFFRSREKTTTISVTPESKTRKVTTTFSPIASDTNPPHSRTELNSFIVTDFQSTTRMPKVKLKNENHDFNRKFEKLLDFQDLKLINTSNEKVFDPIKPMELYDKKKISSSTARNFQPTTEHKSQAPEQINFTFTITLKPPRAQNLKTPIENISYFINNSHTSTGKNIVFKNEKLNQTDLDYDADFQVTENQLKTRKWMSDVETGRSRIFDSQTETPITDIEIKQYLVTIPPTEIQNQPGDKEYTFKDQLFKAPLPVKHTDISPFKYGYRTTPKSSLQTTLPQEFKDTDYNIIYQDIKEFKNDENLESLKANITKENFERDRFEQTSEVPLATEPVEDYIFNIEQQTDVGNYSEISKVPGANQYEIIRNQEMENSADMVAQTEISNENESNEDSTEVQYDDELESIIETFGEKPKLVSLYQSLASTEPITEAPSQTESEENFNNLVLDYGIPILESNQEMTQNQDNNMVVTEIIQVQPQTELPNQNQEETGGQNYSMMNNDWYKGYQNDIIPNSIPEEQSNVIATTYIVPTGQGFEEGYKYEESSNEDEEEDEKDKEEENDNNKDEENEEGDINMTTVKLAEIYQNSPPTETSEDEPEEEEEYDDDSTDFQELLFWQNITKKPHFQLKQPYILPIEMQSFKSDFKTNTTNPIQEADVKAMKLELEQLKQLLDKSSLADKKDPFINLTSTPTINYFTQELTSEKLIDAYGGSKIHNEDSEVVTYPGMETINVPRQNITYSKGDNGLQKTIKDKNNSNETLNLENGVSSKQRNLTYSEEMNKSFLDKPTTIASSYLEESENYMDDSPTDEDEEEDLEISSEDPEVIQFDDLPETIDANNAMEMFSMMDKNGIINHDPNIVRANNSIINESKILDLENPGKLLEITNQVELPPTPTVNASELDQPSLKEINKKLGNDTVQIESAKRYKENYWLAKKAVKALRANPIKIDSKEHIISNLNNEQNSDVILLDNASNDPAEWVLHEDAMCNMDPWESIKQLENNKFDGSSKEAIQRDKLLKDIMMSKIKMNPKFLKEKDGSAINFPNQNNDDLRHHSNLFVKLDRERFQPKSHNIFDQISRKYIKAPHYNKYNKNMWNDGTIVLFQPNFSTLKDKYSEENEKNFEMQPYSFGNNSLGLKGPRLNIKGVPEKANSTVRKYTQERKINQINSSKKSKIHNKSSKHRNPNSKKKIRVKQKIQSPNTALTYRNTTNNLNATAVQPALRLAANNFTHGQNNSLTNKTESSPVNTLSSPAAHQTQSIKDDEEVNQLTTPGPNNNLKVTTNLPCNEFFKAKINKYGNLENLLWDRDDRWDRLDDNLNKVEKLYDRNIIKKINQNFRKNMYGFDTKLLDRGKSLINSSRKSNQKSLMNFYKQRLNRKMTLLKNLQNKNSEDKITPEEERKIKKILDGIVSRYKGRTNDTEDDNYIRFKTNKYNIPARRNLTRIKNHRKFPKTMKLDRNKLKCRSKQRYFINNLTDTMPQHRFISVGRNKKLPTVPIYNRLSQQYSSVKDRPMALGWHPITKICGNKHLFLGNYVPQSEKENYELLHRDKKNYVLGIPYIRTFPNNNSTGFVSVINTQLNKLPNSNETESFNTENSPGNSLYSQKRGKFAYKINDGLSGTPLHGILSLVYPDDVSNSSEPIKEGNGDGTADYQMGSSVAGYSGAGIPFNNYQINNNQFEELLKSLENYNCNITENSENKYKDLAMLFKETQKDSGRNRTQDTVNEVKAKLKAINWLLNFKNSQKINKMAQSKQDVLQSTSCSKQDGSFMESPGKDREEDVENMKKFITKYKTLLKIFEEQYGKIDIKDAINQKFMKNNYREDITTKDGNIIVQRPTALWKKLRSRDKNPLRMDDTNKNIVLDSNSKKKSHKISYMYGQNKQRKDMDSAPDDIQDSEDQEVIKPLQDNDDDNLETCNDIEFESYDEHQLDKIKEKDLAINNMSQIQLNGTRYGPHLQPIPDALMGKYKNLEKYKSYHNGKIPRLKSYRENEGNYRLNSTINKLFKSRFSPLSCIGELNNEKSKGNWDNWTMDKPYVNPKLQQNTDEPQPNMTEDKEVTVHGNDNNNVLMLPIKFNTSDFIKLLNFKEVNDSDSICQDEEINPSNYRTKLWDMNNRNGYVFDVDRGGPNGIKNRYYITFDSLSPNTVKVKNVSTIPMSNFSDFVNTVGPGLNVMNIHKFMSPWEKNLTQSYIDNRNVKGNIQPEIRSIEKVCLWLRKPLSYNLTHQVPKVAISLGEVWPPMSEGQGPRNMKHYLVQVDPLLTLSKFPNQHIDYPSQISKVVWKAILHGFKTPKKTWQFSNQLG